VHIPRVGVVLSGAENDKDTLVSAVRMAAREGARLRIVLAGDGNREGCEKHLDFALWDVQVRLHLTPPEITIESRLREVAVGLQEDLELGAQPTAPGGE
jgi:hypothetical protein